MKGSGKDDREPRRPVGGRLQRHGISVVILSAMTAVFLIAAWTTFVWPPRRPAESDAVVWTAAAAAIATLAAVWASLWNADEAARNADEATRNADTALHIARENADREERLRHETVRPIVSVNATWTRIENRPPQSDEGRVRMRFIHEEGLTGFGVYIVMLSQQGRPFTLGSGGILRPQSGRTKYYGSSPVEGDGVIPCDKTSELFGISSRWTIICRMQDIFGWWWEQRTDQPVEFTNTAPSMPAEGYPLRISMGLPAPVDGPLIDELKPSAHSPS